MWNSIMGRSSSLRRKFLRWFAKDDLQASVRKSWWGSWREGCHDKGNCHLSLFHTTSYVQVSSHTVLGFSPIAGNTIFLCWCIITSSYLCGYYFLFPLAFLSFRLLDSISKCELLSGLLGTSVATASGRCQSGICRPWWGFSWGWMVC